MSIQQSLSNNVEDALICIDDATCNLVEEFSQRLSNEEVVAAEEMCILIQELRTLSSKIKVYKDNIAVYDYIQVGVIA